MLANNAASVELAHEGGLAQIFRGLTSRGWRAKKILLPQYQGLIEFENLQRREFEILSRLDHPKIPKCFELKLESPKPSILTHALEMEWIEGLSLRDLIFQVCSWSLSERKDLAFLFLKQSLEIFSYLESQQLIHADLSPENFILNKNADLILVDFASAQFDGDKPLRGLVQLGGKQSYRAPELGRSSRPTYASEVYSLGRIFEEILGHVNLRDSQIQKMAHQLIFDRKIVQAYQIPEISFDFLEKVNWENSGEKIPKQVTSRLHSVSRGRWSFAVLPLILISSSTFIEVREVSVNTLPVTTLCIEPLSLCDRQTPIKKMNLPKGDWRVVFSLLGDRGQKWSKTLSVKSDKPVKFFEDFRNAVNLKE